MLQRQAWAAAWLVAAGFKPHQRGGGCCSLHDKAINMMCEIRVSNPISGEVGAAAEVTLVKVAAISDEFQTPSAGRWVLQRSRQRLLA